MRKLFTSESVTEGHPDKLCDRISDSVLDAIIEKDPTARVACETVATTGLVMVMGEISTSCYVDIAKIARQAIEEIGYNGEDSGFDYKTCAVVTSIDEQSADIAQGVNSAIERRENSSEDDGDTVGAGDQGMVFGYACNETPELMPMPISLSHKLAKELTRLRKDGEIDYLLPDGKTQVTVEYEDNKPVRVDTVIVSTQHKASASLAQIREDIKEKLIKRIIPAELLDENTKILINPTGRFVTGGPVGDTGLTGRKIIVDTYGGYAKHGGGAFSGKDPTKVDRSAAYAARYAAKNIVAAGLADRCEIQISYAIGVAHPVSINVETYGTAKVDEAVLENAVAKVFDLRPGAIIRDLDLRKPIYKELSSYGHMGREDLGVQWEKCDRIDALLEAVK